MSVPYIGGKCLTPSVVYKAAISTKDIAHQTKNYIGVTAGPFKERFNNHRKSINNFSYRKETKLSKYAWELKEQGMQFDIKWSVIKRVPAYSAGGKSCELCLEEKLLILKSKKEQTLNKRSELFAKCRHKNKFSAQNFQRARALIVIQIVSASARVTSANIYLNGRVIVRLMIVP